MVKLLLLVDLLYYVHYSSTPGYMQYTRYIVHAAEISGNKQLLLKLAALNSCNKIIVPAERSLTDFVFQYGLRALHHEDTRNSGRNRTLSQDKGGVS